STNSTNELNAAYSVSTATGHSSRAQGGHAFYRVKRFYKKTGRKLKFNGKEPVGFDKTKVECCNCHRRGHFARDCRIAKNLGNRGRDAGNAGYKRRDNGKRPAREEDEKALFNEKEVLDVNEEEVTKTVCDNRSSVKENSLANDRFKKDRMAKKSVLPNNVGKGTGHRESRPVWNNVQRINYQNKYDPTAIFTRFGRIPVTAAKPKAAASTSVAKLVNTAGPKQSVNFSNSRSTFHKSHTPIRRSFYNAKAHLRSNSTERVNTAGSKVVSVVKGNEVTTVKVNEVTAVKASAGCVWRPRVNEIDQISKDNRALVTTPHNKTPYELLNGRSPRLDFMRPFGFLVTILNTLDLLEVSDQHHIVLPLWSSISSTYKSSDDKAEDDKSKDDIGSKTVVEPVNKEDQAYRDELNTLMSQEIDASDVANSLCKEFEQGCMYQRGAAKAGSTNSFNIVSNPVNAASTSGTFSAGGPSSPHPDAFIPNDMLLHVDQDDSQIPNLEDTAKLRSTGIFTSAYDDDLDTFTSPVQSVGAEAEFNNMESSTVISPIPTHRVHIGHPKDQILGNTQSAVQTKGMKKKSSRAHAFEKAIETKWVYRNKKDKRDIVVRNKGSLVTQGHKQEEYDEVFAPMARIKAIRIFLAFVSFMGFIVYKMDVKSAFLYGTIEEEVEIIVMTLFIKMDKDDIMLVQVYVDDIIFGSTKESLCDEFEALMHKKFLMSSMGRLAFFLGLQVKPSKEGIFISQDKFQVTPKLLHLHVVKRIFRYLKGQPKFGLWYPRDSPFDLEAYSDSNFAGANLDRKSITREYVAAANCYRQVLWIQN
nr:ribonuclease H-like domain-containing protein [Tanacetum cinerariifolium]